MSGAQTSGAQTSGAQTAGAQVSGAQTAAPKRRRPNGGAQTSCFAFVDTYQQARFKAATAPHAGDWLFALPVSACGLRMDDEAVRMAVGLRLGTRTCEP